MDVLSLQNPCRTSILNALYHCVESQGLKTLDACIEAELNQDPRVIPTLKKSIVDLLSTQYNDLMHHTRAYFIQPCLHVRSQVITILLQHLLSNSTLYSLYHNVIPYIEHEANEDQQEIYSCTLTHPLIYKKEAYHAQTLHNLLSIDLIKYSSLFGFIKKTTLPFTSLLCITYIQTYLNLQTLYIELKEKIKSSLSPISLKALIHNEWQTNKLGVFLPYLTSLLTKPDAIVTYNEAKRYLKTLISACHEHLVKQICDALLPDINNNATQLFDHWFAVKPGHHASLFASTLTSANDYLYQSQFLNNTPKRPQYAYLERPGPLNTLIIKTTDIADRLIP